MASATLDTIRVKVRRLTHSPSQSQITNTEIDEYINTFYQYDFPEHLRIFTNYIPFSFYTKPNVDSYSSNGDPLTAINQLSDFKNRVVSVHPPVYIDGKPAFFSQSPSQFFAVYPKNKSIGSIGSTGDGATTGFTGTLSSVPIQQGSVSFTSIGANNIGLNLVDDGAGTLSGDGSGTIDYLTGAFSLTFSSAPASGKEITFHVLPYTAARPYGVLYQGNAFTLRPIPDKVYEVSMQIFQTFTDLVNSSDVPELNQWWQYIAYGAAKKVFEDRADMDGVAMIMPEFRQQERLILRRSLVQQSNERSATIYTENVGIGAGGFGFDPNGTAF